MIRHKTLQTFLHMATSTGKDAMKKHAHSVTAITAAISLLIITGCGGGGGGGSSAFDTDGVDGNTPASAPSFAILESDAAATSLTGPLVYQTGQTAVMGTESIAFFNDPAIPAPFSYIIDTSANTIDDAFGAAFTPRVTYDDLGRGILVEDFVSSGETFITIAYNDDHTIASTQATRDGEVVTNTAFNYEDGRLINKVRTAEDFVLTITYNYENDTLVSAEEDFELFTSILNRTFYEFTVDAAGRVIEVTQTGLDVPLERTTNITYDANGNISRAEDFSDSAGVVGTQISTYTYAASAEPTVSIAGLLVAISDSFVPFFLDESSLAN